MSEAKWWHIFGGDVKLGEHRGINKDEPMPAFPRQFRVGNTGMTLRDYFAAAALPAIFAYASGLNLKPGAVAADIAANGSYELADAMLKARESEKVDTGKICSPLTPKDK